MRYIVAILIACSLFLVGTAYCWLTAARFRAEFEQWVRDAASKGQLPEIFKGTDPSQLNPGEVGFEVSASWMRRIQITDALYTWRYLEFAILCGTAIAIAYLTRNPPMDWSTCRITVTL